MAKKKRSIFFLFAVKIILEIKGSAVNNLLTKLYAEQAFLIAEMVKPVY